MLGRNRDGVETESGRYWDGTWTVLGRSWANACNKKYYEILAPLDFLISASEKIRNTSDSPVLKISY